MVAQRVRNNDKENGMYSTLLVLITFLCNSCTNFKLNIFSFNQKHTSIKKKNCFTTRQNWISHDGQYVDFVLKS